MGSDGWIKAHQVEKEDTFGCGGKSKRDHMLRKRGEVGGGRKAGRSHAAVSTSARSKDFCSASCWHGGEAALSRLCGRKELPPLPEHKEEGILPLLHRGRGNEG